MTVNLEVGKSYIDILGRRVDIEYRSPNVCDGNCNFVGVVHDANRFVRLFACNGSSFLDRDIVGPWVEPRPTIAPGWWECRDGKKRWVAARIPDELVGGHGYTWVGIDRDGDEASWTDEGRYLTDGESARDLIRPTTPPVKE